ncbi:MAG: cupin domain-containing protein [Hellea sp.]|nr:cupin domain-containing protein [Hellea sp.]
MSIKFDVWPLEILVSKNKINKAAFYEFLDVDTMSAEIFELPAGGKDTQKPHDWDELYYIISGKAQFMCDGESQDVMTGDTIFVSAFLDHYFYDIEQDMKILVVFSKKPPEQEDDL